MFIGRHLVADVLHPVMFYRFDMPINGAACPERVDCDTCGAHCWDCLLQRNYVTHRSSKYLLNPAKSEQAGAH